MSTPTDLRARKRLATRQAISTAATKLFLKRGFDQVTVDEIAAAADVGRMTVFNHFPRKEDLFFDLDEEARELVLATLRQRPARSSAIETLRLLAHQCVKEQRPFVEFSARSQGFIETVAASETLKARARAIRDEIAQRVAETLAQGASRPADDPEAQLAAHLLLATWTVAFQQAHRRFRETGKTADAQVVFLTLLDRGSQGLKAAMTGTPYA